MTYTTDRDLTDYRDTVRYRVGGQATCSHPPEQRLHLGHAGPTGFYRCLVCDAVLVDAGPADDAELEPVAAEVPVRQ